MKKVKKEYLWEHFYNKEDLDIKIPNCSLYDYMIEETKSFRNLDAINYFGRRINYGMLWEYIDKCARAFKKLGIKKGDVITICMPNTPEAAISFFACNKIGAVANMIHPLSAEEEIKHYLNVTKSVLLIAFNQVYPKLRNIIKETSVNKVIIASASESMPLFLNGLYQVTKGRKEEKPVKDNLYIFWKKFLEYGNYYNGDIDCKLEASDRAVILHSGGTTGTPKSIVLLNKSLMTIAEQAKVCFPNLYPGDTMLTVLPLFHCFGLVVCLYGPLCLGVSCILVPTFDAKRFDKLLTKYQPNVIAGVPTLFEALIKNEHMDNVDLSQVKYVISGGDSLPVQRNKAVNDFLESHNCYVPITQGFGMTETCGPATFGALGSGKLGSVGVPLPGNIIKIIDPETKCEKKTGEVGEICVGGNAIMEGYLNDPKSTKETLVKLDDDNYYVLSGDLGYFDEDGVLFYVQRMKRIIISSGYNIYPQHVENVLRENKYIKDACLVGMPHPYKKEIAKVFIILEDGVEETYTVKKEIMDYAKKNLAHYMLPREYIYKKEFPKTKLAKTDYKKLEEELINR